MTYRRAGPSFTRPRLRDAGRRRKSRPRITFPHIWKDADPDISLLLEAKAECAKLQ